MDKPHVNGGTLSWSVTCTTPKITVHQEWIVHYHGETMGGQVTSRSTTPDRTPVESTTQLKGRYLGHHAPVRCRGVAVLGAGF